MDAAAVKKMVGDKIRSARDCYIQDLEAMDEAVLRSSPGGTARIPLDFTYEVIYVNKRILCRLTGNEPEAFDAEGWITAPEEFQSKAAAIAGIRESTDKVLEAWEAVPDNEIDKVITLPNGETTPLAAAHLCATHLMYHDAQLNYVQSLMGDDEMHWN